MPRGYQDRSVAIVARRRSLRLRDCLDELNLEIKVIGGFDCRVLTWLQTHKIVDWGVCEAGP
jgi:hypothetical protein